MEPVTCSSCHTWVAPKKDGTCPACGSPINALIGLADAAENPSGSSRATTSLLRESSSERAYQRPTGLTILAVIQFFIAGSSAINILRLIASPQLRAEVEALGGSVGGWQIVIMVATTVLLTISALGYLSQSRRSGYWLGNAVAISAVLLGLVSVASGRHVLLQIPGMVYWTITFLMLNLFYRDSFR